AELKLEEEETAKRVEEAIQKKVEDSLNYEEMKLEEQMRLAEGRRKLLDEEQARKKKEELAKMLKGNRRKMEEAQRREALEQQ
ncbi:hypothetical protein U1Q18_005109, partial [Sarracenia purpurea var. burkii]